MNKTAKILVAGAAGMVGSSIVRKLKENGYTNIVGTFRNRMEGFEEGVTYTAIDFVYQTETAHFFKEQQFDYVFLAAAKVGGIVANNLYRADFIYDNLQIQNNIIHHSYLNGVKKLMFLGSSCIYPRNTPQPMTENSLLTDILEYTNESYALAKIAGIRMCESYNLQYNTNFIAVMPTNLYGELDNFDLEKSHVLPALIRKMYLARCLETNQLDKIQNDFRKLPFKGLNGTQTTENVMQGLKDIGIEKNTETNHVTLRLWGSGTPMREFLHANDLADACVFLMENIDFEDILRTEYNIHDRSEIHNREIRNLHFNVGTGKDMTIAQLAEMIRNIAGFEGTIEWDTTKPDGTPRKLLSVAKLNSYGWQPKIGFKQGVTEIYQNYTQGV